VTAPAGSTRHGQAELLAEQVHRFSSLIAPHIRRTPLLSLAEAGFLKLESLQVTGSFKVRGFFAAALALDPDRAGGGILTVSAGNAALACAHVAHHLGVRCAVVMPETAPRVKVNGVRDLGAEIRLLPREDLNAWIAARGWEAEPGTFIHPFANETVMAGHGSIGLEIVEQHPAVQRILVPVGGGGLACGIAAALSTVRPDVVVVGVQSDGYALWPRSFAAGGPVVLHPQTIADGTTAPFDAGMFERLKRCVAEWTVVPEHELRTAAQRLALEHKVVAEGAGALGYAALLREVAPQNTVAVVSGGNIDTVLLGALLTDEQH
jgi:threonine dehydratase